MGKNISNIKYDVIIKGAYGASNFGDDALIYSILENFFLGKNIAVIGKENTYWEDIFPNVIYFSNNENVNLHANILVYGGGTQFFNFKSFRYFFKKIIAILFNPIIIKNKIFPQKKLSLNFDYEIYLGVGLGPFQDEKIKDQTLMNIKNKKNLYVRDSLSMNYLDNESFKIDDICLMDHMRYKCNISGEKNNKIAIIIRDWDFDNNYKHVNHILNFYKKNTKYNLEFIFFGNDKRCKEILNKANIKFIEWNPKKDTILGFSSLLSEYKLIISSRYHGIIFSLIHNIPAIAINIEPKLSQVSKEYPNISLWNSSYDSQQLDKLIEKALYVDFNKNFKISSIETLNSQLNDLISRI